VVQFAPLYFHFFSPFFLPFFLPSLSQLVFFGPHLGALVPPLYKNLTLPLPVAAGAPPAEQQYWWLAAMRAAGDYAMTCDMRKLARAVVAQGKRIRDPASTGASFVYLFKHAPQYSMNVQNLPALGLGAFHGAEVSFVECFALTVQVCSFVPPWS
jgi:hypothetical protein